VIRTHKYYPAPTPIGNRFSEKDRITLRQAIDLMQDIIKTVPTEVQQEVYIVGWDQVAIYADQKVTREEMTDIKLGLFEELLDKIKTDGESAELLEKYLNKIREVK
jgi:hypothetical protein